MGGERGQQTFYLSPLCEEYAVSKTQETRTFVRQHTLDRLVVEPYLPDEMPSPGGLGYAMAIATPYGSRRRSRAGRSAGPTRARSRIV